MVAKVLQKHCVYYDESIGNDRLNPLNDNGGTINSQYTGSRKILRY